MRIPPLRLVRAAVPAFAILTQASCSLVGVGSGKGACASGQDTFATRVSPNAYATKMDGVYNMVTGEARSLSTGAPLRNVTIELRPGAFKGVTDSSGAFSFRGVPPGNLTVTARRHDVVAQSALVTLEAGAGVNVQFELASLNCDASVNPAARKPGQVPRSAPPPRLP